MYNHWGENGANWHCQVDCISLALKIGVFAGQFWKDWDIAIYNWKQQHLHVLFQLFQVCVYLEPCDFVMYSPALYSVMDIFDRSKKRPNKSSLQQKDVLDSPNMSSETGASNMPSVTSSGLPLLYVNMSNIRIFLPGK